jgi:putative ABC transport system ATP-binding protein
MAMIELRRVSKTVRSAGQPLTILQPTDLVVEPGEFLSVVGSSGSGKSTLLGLIAGLDAPSSGEIMINGVEITGLDEDRLARLRGAKIGFVFQSFHLIPTLSAFENILVPLEIAGEVSARERAEELLGDVGLTDRGHHYPAQLSGGEQQRVAIARALANDPPILLADEPTGNLDSSTGHQVIDLLVEINRSKGMTIIMVTHDAELTNRSDRVLSMRDGKTESAGLRLLEPSTQS